AGSLPTEASRASSRRRYTRLVEQLPDLRDAHRLDQVAIEAGGKRALAIASLSVAGHGDEADLRKRGQHAQSPGELVAIDDRQADIEKHELGLEVATHLERLVGVVRDARVEAPAPEHVGEQH